MILDHILLIKVNLKKGITKTGELIEYDQITIPLINRFYFYDQAHITGIDMKIYGKAKCLITVSSFNRFRDIAQGIFRMRNINKGQTIDFIVNENTKNLIDKYVHLVEFLLHKEQNYQESQKILFYKQNILSLYRTYFENNKPK